MIKFRVITFQKVLETIDPTLDPIVKRRKVFEKIYTNNTIFDKFEFRGEMYFVCVCGE